MDGFKGIIRPLDQRLSQKQEIWKKMAAHYNLIEVDLNRISNACHTDLDLGRQIEVMTDMSNSRKLGFTGCTNTKDSFFKLFAQLQKHILIP